MEKRQTIALGMALGALWGAALIWAGTALIVLPVFSLLPTLAFAFLGPGIVLALIVGRLAQRRFFDDVTIDGDAFAPGAPGEIDARVLQNTVEQLLLALCLWPPVAYLLGTSGPGVAVALGCGFALARLAFWVGYHRAPPLRAFGFAATFYPTVLALLWALVQRI